MIKLTALFLTLSLSLTGAMIAQEPAAEESPAAAAPSETGKKAGREPQAQSGGQSKAERKAERKEARRDAAAEQNAAPSSGAQEAPQTGQGKGDKKAARQEQKAARKEQKAAGQSNSGEMQTTPDAAVSGSTEAAAATGQKANRKENNRKGKGQNESVGASTAPSSETTTTTGASTETSTTATASPAEAGADVSATTTTSAAPATATTTTTGEATAGQRNQKKAAKKLERQRLQQIQTEVANFKAEARPQQVPSVSFRQDYRIQGAEQWQGPQYEVYRSYRPERRDRSWYESRYDRVELIGGGYYYYNSGYWYPAWGYSPQHEYYAYDAPIYVGQRALPPDQVIAQVQAVLKEMGYYRGQVDGLLGPLTREALIGYQSDTGLRGTAVIDQPTLDSLGMTS